MKNCAFFEAQIDLLLDGALTPSEEAELLAHLASCPACAEREGQLREMKAALAALDIVEIPAGLHGRILDALPAQGEPKPARAAGGRWVKILAGVAACALLALVVVRLPRMSGGTAGVLMDSGGGTCAGAAPGGALPPAASGENALRGDACDGAAPKAPQEEPRQDMMITAESAEEYGDGLNGAALPASAAAYAYAGDLEELEPELESFDSAAAAAEEGCVQIAFKTGSEGERVFLNRLSALDFAETELPEDAKEAYAPDEAAPYTLYILIQD